MLQAVGNLARTLLTEGRDRVCANRSPGRRNPAMETSVTSVLPVSQTVPASLTAAVGASSPPFAAGALAPEALTGPRDPASPAGAPAQVPSMFARVLAGQIAAPASAPGEATASEPIDAAAAARGEGAALAPALPTLPGGDRLRPWAAGLTLAEVASIDPAGTGETGATPDALAAPIVPSLLGAAVVVPAAPALRSDAAGAGMGADPLAGPGGAALSGGAADVGLPAGGAPGEPGAGRPAPDLAGLIGSADPRAAARSALDGVAMGAAGRPAAVDAAGPAGRASLEPARGAAGGMSAGEPVLAGAGRVSAGGPWSGPIDISPSLAGNASAPAISAGIAAMQPGGPTDRALVGPGAPSTTGASVGPLGAPAGAQGLAAGQSASSLSPAGQGVPGLAGMAGPVPGEDGAARTMPATQAPAVMLAAPGAGGEAAVTGAAGVDPAGVPSAAGVADASAPADAAAGSGARMGTAQTPPPSDPADRAAGPAVATAVSASRPAADPIADTMLPAGSRPDAQAMAAAPVDARTVAARSESQVTAAPLRPDIQGRGDLAGVTEGRTGIALDITVDRAASASPGTPTGTLTGTPTGTSSGSAAGTTADATATDAGVSADAAQARPAASAEPGLATQGVKVATAGTAPAAASPADTVAAAEARDRLYGYGPATADESTGDVGETLARPEGGTAAAPRSTGDAAAQTAGRPAPAVAFAPVGVSATALTFAAAVTAADPATGEGGDPLSMSGLGGLESGRSDPALQAQAQAAQAGRGAAQTAAAASHLAAEVARFAGKGQTRFQIRMDPPELGRVDVELKIARDGTVRAHLTVERSETLDMFLRDQRGLERALDAAGLKLEQGSLQLSLKDQGGGGFAQQHGFSDGFRDGERGSGRAAAGSAGEPGGQSPETGPAEVSRVRIAGAAGRLDIQI